MIVVAACNYFLDIDAYAGCVALAELLNLLGEPAVAAGSAPLNASITPHLRGLPTDFRPDYRPAADDRFVIVDVSDPEVFDPIVDPAKVIAIYDHHSGFQDYWLPRLRGTCRIEDVGAAATLVFERWAAAGRTDAMSQGSAELLAAAILDNTLHFRSGLATARDHKAYDALARHAKLDDAWITGYFTDCQQSILADLPEAVRNDTKRPELPGLEGGLCTGQLVVWDASSILDGRVDEVAAVMAAMDSRWLVNIVSISEGRSYFLSDDEAVKAWSAGLLGISYDGRLATADRLWLRKEIMKAASDAHPQRSA